MRIAPHENWPTSHEEYSSQEFLMRILMRIKVLVINSWESHEKKSSQEIFFRPLRSQLLLPCILWWLLFAILCCLIFCREGLFGRVTEDFRRPGRAGTVSPWYQPRFQEKCFWPISLSLWCYKMALAISWHITQSNYFSVSDQRLWLRERCKAASYFQFWKYRTCVPSWYMLWLHHIRPPCLDRNTSSAVAARQERKIALIALPLCMLDMSCVEIIMHKRRHEYASFTTPLQ